MDIAVHHIKGSSSIGIQFGRSKYDGYDPLMGFVDSDFAGNIDTRESQFGYVFNLFGSAVSWRSSLQSVVALSTTEAEYIAITKAVKEGIWLKGLLNDFGIEQGTATIKCDSQSVLHLAKHQVFHERSKHIDVKLHFVRYEVNKGVVKMVKVSMKENAADMLTKTLPTEKFKYYLDLVSICSL